MGQTGKRVAGVVLLGAVLVGWALAWPNDAIAAPAEADVRAVAEGNADFALDLYARLRTEEGNLFLSPYSISTALAMTWAGAKGDTAEQMAKVLHFPMEPGRLHPAFAALLPSAREGDKVPYELHMANALWGQKGYGFMDEFLALTREHYGAGLRVVDFLRATEQARQTINTWVEEQTHDKIKGLLKTGDLAPDTRLVLTNAVYFKGIWASQFDKKQTKDGPFHVSSDRQVTVPMMNQTGPFAFATADDLSILELPYKGDRLSMVLLLPKKVNGLAGLERSLNRKSLDRWLGQLKKQTLRASLPRFTVEARFELSKVLQAMGMTDAFSAAADFSGMNGRRDLFISLVAHKAWVDVNEEGTEAAAATGVVTKRTSLPAFVADHPFVFLIRDRQTGSILFLGRMANPNPA